MGAVGHHLAVRHQHDPVGQGDGRRSMRNHEGGPVPHDLQHGVADLVLLGRVDRRCGVIEDEHQWIGDDRPRYGEALSLPTREAETALADNGVVTLREVHDELVGSGQTRGLLNVLGGGAGLGERDVLGHGGVEQERLFEDHADPANVTPRDPTQRTSTPRSSRTEPESAS